MSNRLTLLLLMSALLSGCSSSPSPEKYAGKIRDQLTTDIKDNGLKLFTYRASLAMMPTLSRAQPQSKREAIKMARQMQQAREDFEEQFDLGLARTLEMTGYCRDGYLELFRMVEADRGELKGECNEGASDSDMTRFGTSTN
ncbi:hypothetical protein L2750_21795 [Shewanella submarina]|uniref:Lipoprotein n=1 Tax=Shewanella submarina TaxID=2016376 RepID=A0ABV7GC01_9GAMM|nr:hypothetical protein [Shewanella submarina]MCL1039743.1 hypothetical protein [Shewanella submarina]